MSDDKPKMLLFEPPIGIYAAKAGEVVSCTPSGEFEHTGELKVAAIPDLATLIGFIQAVDADQVQCVLKLNGQIIRIAPWLAFHLEALEKAGRVKLVDVPEPGESASATEAPGE